MAKKLRNMTIDELHITRNELIAKKQHFSRYFGHVEAELKSRGELKDKSHG